MPNFQKINLLKYLIPIFYAAAVVLMIVFAWNQEKTVMHIDLTKSPAYIKRGFDHVQLVPENFDRLAEDLRAQNSDWVRFHETWPLVVMDSLLADLPKRNFMSPLGGAEEEFTILIPLEIDAESFYLTPGLYLAGIGDNWQIFFNGALIASEIHLDKNGKILEQRSWRDISFPIDRSLILPGINILAFRIIGDPTYGNTGLFYGSSYYIDDYKAIEKRQGNFLLLILSGIFLVSGIYYLSFHTKQEIYYLLFSIFSLMLFVFAIFRHNAINLFIPNTAISQRIEFYAYMLAVIAFGMFTEAFGRGKITKISWGYLFFTVYFIATIQFFPAKQYRNDFALIVNLTNILYYLYVFSYSIVYWYFFDKKGPKGNNLDTSVIAIISGTLLIFISDIFEIASYFISFSNYNFFLSSTFTVQIGMIFALALRYKESREQVSNMENELQQNQIAIMLSQIQPHFMYNSLAVIHQLCTTDPKKAEETVIEFSNYLRGNLDSLTIKELIPFEQELRHVITYLALEKKRFEEKLNIVYDLKIENFKLPVLTLQTIVENAVRYGITKKEDGGTIKISTEKANDNVVITVTDDGVGFDLNREQGTGSREHIGYQLDNQRSHVGLENVRSRLRTMCGGSLEIQSEQGVGTTVAIIIPINKERVYE